MLDDLGAGLGAASLLQNLINYPAGDLVEGVDHFTNVRRLRVFVTLVPRARKPLLRCDFQEYFLQIGVCVCQQQR